MRILILNWKDINNPEAGGAELFTHEIAKRWVGQGHEVTIFCRRFGGCASSQEMDGVRVIRRGTRISVYGEAKRWFSRSGETFDLVIDEINTRPFGTPRFAQDTPVIALIHQLARDVWFEEARFPLNWVGRHLLEPHWLRAYRNVPTVTVSESTARDLRRMGFARVNVVPVGIDPPVPPVDIQKATQPTLLFVGRLVRTKRPLDALAAFDIISRQVEDAQLWIIGDGYLRDVLHRECSPNVKILGKVPNREKFERMAQAHLLLVPGVREGWGLVVLEANAVETPAVGYAIPGLVDAIRDKKTGLLVSPSPDALAEGALQLLRHRELRVSLGREARLWSQQFGWDDTADAFLKIVEVELGLVA